MDEEVLAEERRLEGDTSNYWGLLKEVVKRFGRLSAVKGVSVIVPAGELFGLGSNNAGKTTTLKMITGDLKPTSGAMRFFNISRLSSICSFMRL